MIVRELVKANQESLSKGVYLVLLHANKIPPHLGVLIEGAFYSLMVSGPVINMELAVLLRTVHQKQMPSLFVGIKGAKWHHLKDLCARKMKAYERVDEQTSCLKPINDFVNEAYSLDDNKSQFVFELLKHLELKQLLTNENYHFYLSQELKEGNYELLVYTMEEINTRIRKLNQQNVVRENG